MPEYTSAEKALKFSLPKLFSKKKRLADHRCEQGLNVNQSWFEAKAKAVASKLHERIASGEAEPISDKEREQLEEIRALYKARFGDDQAS